MSESKSIPRCLRLLLVAVTCAALFGCVSAHLTHLDPAFTPTALEEGELAIGGVAVIGTAEKLSARQTASIIDFVRREMKRRRPEVAVLAHAGVPNVLGSSDLETLLAEAASDKGIEPSLLAPLATKGARHVLFIVISYNVVDRYVTNQTDVRNIYDDDGKATGRSVKFVTIAQAKRSVTAEYRIFDVTTGERVWASESSNSRSISRTADSREGYPPAPDFASAPTASRVIRSMTTAVVKELPAPEKRQQQQLPFAPNVPEGAGADASEHSGESDTQQ